MFARITWPYFVALGFALILWDTAGEGIRSGRALLGLIIITVALAAAWRAQRAAK